MTAARSVACSHTGEVIVPNRHPPRDVNPGQVWSITAYARGLTRARTEIRVDQVDFDPIVGRRAVCTDLRTGRSRPVTVRSLTHGHLGAVLVREADGRAPAELPKRMDYVEKEPERTVEIFEPRGILQREISLFETRCTQLRAKGMKPAEIARKLRTNLQKVLRSLENVQAIRETMAIKATGT
jgi:hypothetical protein